MSFLKDFYESEPVYESVVVTLNDQEYAVNVRKDISLQDFMEACRRAAEMCFSFDENGKPVSYHPANKQFAENYVILRYWTDVDLNKLRELCQSDEEYTDALWRLCIKTDLIFKIEMTGVTEGFYGAREEIIDELKREMCPGLDEVWKNVNDFLDSIKTQFGEMSEEDIEATREAIKKLGGMDEGKIVELLK